MQAMLSSDQWDLGTLQQRSLLSYQIDSYGSRAMPGTRFLSASVRNVTLWWLTRV